MDSRCAPGPALGGQQQALHICAPFNFTAFERKFELLKLDLLDNGPDGSRVAVTPEDIQVICHTGDMSYLNSSVERVGITVVIIKQSVASRSVNGRGSLLSATHPAAQCAAKTVLTTFLRLFAFFLSFFLSSCFFPPLLLSTMFDRSKRPRSARWL